MFNLKIEWNPLNFSDLFSPQATPPKVAASAASAQTQSKAMKAQMASMSLESVRHDVRNLGIEGLGGRTKIEARLAQLKSLGAEVGDMTLTLFCTQSLVNDINPLLLTEL